MIRFSIFGIPVTVEPFFWLVMAFIGGGYQALSSSSPDLYMNVVLFMLAGFISVLVHELGHALVGRKLGGGSVWIKLWAFGGLAYQQGARFDRRGKCAMILAGPGAGFLLAALFIGLLFIIFPLSEAVARLSIYMKYTNVPHSSMVQFFPGNKPVYSFLNAMIWVNVWWSLINLLPIFPMDGGQFMDQFVRTRKLVHKISIITCVTILALMLLSGKTMGLILLAYFAYQNFVAYRAANN